MTRLVLGVIGHVDHGKTSLVRALTGQDTDRLAEEKARGISIALGFAHLKVGADGEIDLIDMPGHERFVRTMISGATGIDAVLLVVAANEGIKPQTIEHIDIAGLLGLKRAVVAISKTDLVPPEQAARVADHAMQLLEPAGLQALPPVMTSALQEQGIRELQHALEGLVASHSQPAADGLLFLPIDRAFSIVGHGPVVTGTLRGSTVTTGDTLELFPSRQKIRVRAVQVHGATVTAAHAGQRVALNLRDVEVTELQRGMVLAAADTLTPSDWLTAHIRATASAVPLKNGVKLRALLGTSEIDVRLRLLDRDVLEAGAVAFAQLRCIEPIVVTASEHVILRLPSPPQTVAGGRVLEPVSRRERRNHPRVLQRLADLQQLPRVAMMNSEINRLRALGTTLRHLSQLSALPTSSVAELLKTEPVIVTRSGVVVRRVDMDELSSRVPSLLQSHPSGLSHSKLLAMLVDTSPAVLNEALAGLLARGVIQERGRQFLLPRPDEDQARARDEAELISHIAESLRQAGLTPPNPGEIVTSPQTKRAVERLLREGVIVRAVDRAKGREMLFHRDAIKDAQRTLAPLLRDAPGLLVTEIGAALGISRKYSMPLLDHLDSIRFTRRINDRRVRA